MNRRVSLGVIVGVLLCCLCAGSAFGETIPIWPSMEGSVHAHARAVANVPPPEGPPWDGEPDYGIGDNLGPGEALACAWVVVWDDGGWVDYSEQECGTFCVSSLEKIGDGVEISAHGGIWFSGTNGAGGDGDFMSTWNGNFWIEPTDTFPAGSEALMIVDARDVCLPPGAGGYVTVGGATVSMRQIVPIPVFVDDDVPVGFGFSGQYATDQEDDDCFQASVRIDFEVIPEPATMSLLALGACLPLFRRKRR